MHVGGTLGAFEGYAGYASRVRWVRFKFPWGRFKNGKD